jgi:tetratricopeptide (TPR) repeat protein
MGMAQQKTGKNSAAIKSFQKAIELDKKYAEAHAALGSAYRSYSQYSVASRSYQAALKPEQAAWHLSLGIIYQTMEDYENAIAAYEAYLKYTPTESSKRANQIRTLIPQLKNAIR